ncbi:MAG: hypothetical protein EAX96_19025 [Candidatus Lokiarchaeota archaeon]|nr:hypothetical protein [Candidatus Lokiarchaeota archaeon]
MDLEELVVKKPYKVSYDKSILSNFEFPNFKLVLRRALCGNPNPKTGEYLFYRIIENPIVHEKCLQFILFYNFQKFPPHKHDYHSFLIYLDNKNNVKSLIYDKGHHRSKIIYPKREKNILLLSVMMWDHHYILLPVKGWKKRFFWLTRPLKFTLKPLNGRQIWYFWTIPSMAQLKLRSKLIDPWDPQQFVTFRDVFYCPKCGKEHHMDYMNVKGSTLSLDIECNGHLFNAEYDLQNQKLYSKKIE